MQNIKLPYKAREAVIKLSNDYSSVTSEAKYKAILAKERRSELTPHVKIIIPK